MNQVAEKLPAVELVADMPSEVYHAQPNYSSSQIKDFINHPPAYFHAKYIAKTMTPVTKKHFDIGGAVHSLWMEPENFDSEFVVAPKINRRTNAGKAEWAAWEEANADKTLMTKEQGQQVALMVGQLNRSKAAMALKNQCLVENSLFWTDPETNLDLQVRPDLWRQTHYLADLKSTKSADPVHFKRDIYNYGYHISAAMYLDGVREYGEELTDYLFICVENVEPYLVAVYALDEEAIEIGRTQYIEALRGIRRCLDTNHWPSYNDDQVAEISIPQWAINREVGA